jgi:hypothetical protein
MVGYNYTDASIKSHCYLLLFDQFTLTLFNLFSRFRCLTVFDSWAYLSFHYFLGGLFGFFALHPCLFGEEAPLLDSRRRCEAVASSQFFDIDLAGPEDAGQEVGSVVVDECSVGVEGCSVDIVALFHQLSDFVVDPYELVCRKGHYR